MTDRNRPVPKFSAFSTATTPPASVLVEISINDVFYLRPDWTSQQAQAFLDYHSAVIAQMMVIGAMQIMHQLLQSDSGKDRLNS